MSKILGQLTDYNDVLNMQIQTTTIKSDKRFVISAKMRATVQVCQPENSGATTNTPGKTSEDDEQVSVENNKKEEKWKETKANEDGWIKPFECAPVAHFYKK